MSEHQHTPAPLDGETLYRTLAIAIPWLRLREDWERLTGPEQLDFNVAARRLTTSTEVPSE